MRATTNTVLRANREGIIMRASVPDDSSSTKQVKEAGSEHFKLHAVAFTISQLLFHTGAGRLS